MTASRRYHYVDLLRGLAALAVLFAHYRWFYVGTDQTDLPLKSVLWPLYGYGGWAVQLFWTLSGFVFAHAYREISVREFFVHRVARLYPLHLATLCIVGVLQMVSLQRNGTWQIYENNDLPHFLLQLTFASDWLATTDGWEGSFNGPIWTVSVEVLVYFVFLAYLKAGRRWLAPALALVGLALAPTHLAVFQCMWLFFIGVSLFYVTERYRGLLLTLPFIGVVVLAAMLWVVGLGAQIPRLCVYVGAPALLLVFVALDGRFTLPKRWHWIGCITYSVYLLHMPLLIGIRTFTTAYAPYLSSPLSLLAWVSVVVLLAIPTFYWFERPAQNWLRRVLRPRPRTAQARG